MCTWEDFMGKLEVGRMYVDGQGFVVGPMCATNNHIYPFFGNWRGENRSYTASGQRFSWHRAENKDIDFEASEKRFPREKPMKFHKNMTVKLRCGAEIKGVGLSDAGYPKVGDWTWGFDGAYFAHCKDARDIVEVLSKPETVKCVDVEPVVGMLVTSPGFLVPWEIKAVETARVAEPNRVRNRYHVLLTKVGNSPSLRVWEDLTDWTVEDNNG
jgi:hypothetical protein